MLNVTKKKRRASVSSYEDLILCFSALILCSISRVGFMDPQQKFLICGLEKILRCSFMFAGNTMSIEIFIKQNIGRGVALKNVIA